MFVNRSEVSAQSREWFNLANRAAFHNDSLANPANDYALAYHNALVYADEFERTEVDRYSREGWITECIDALPDILYSMRPDPELASRRFGRFPQPSWCECDQCQWTEDPDWSDVEPMLRYLCGPIPRPVISKPHEALTLFIADLLSPPLRDRI